VEWYIKIIDSLKKFKLLISDNSCGIRRPFICEKLKSGEVNTNTFVQPLSFGDGKPCSNGYATFGGKILLSIYFNFKQTSTFYSYNNWR
jgi:hypothetical protein